MYFSVIAVLIVPVFCRRDVRARPQDEDTFVHDLSPIRSYNDLNGEDTYVDSTHEEYQPTTTSVPLKVARDDTAFLSSLTQGATAKASAFTHASVSSNAAAGQSAPFTLNAIGNLDSAASSFNGFHQGGGNGFSFASGGSGSGFGNAPPNFGQNGGSNFAGHGGGEFFHHGNNGGGGHGYGGGAGGGHGYGGGGGHGYGGEGGGNDGHNHLTPVIHKSVYVHVAPPEEEVPQQKVIVPKVPPKKNYQIVFIKAPTPPPPSAPVIPPFPPQSDKTLIYVLHPKPEEAPPIHIPAPPQNQPVKPEVYFIRYKTKKEDEGGYHRRYGRDDIEDDGDESVDVIDSATRSVPNESDVPASQYDDSDSSGESSNIVRYYTTERGKNAH